MSAFVTAGAGFLLAVLWFDLMFDFQVARHRGADVPEEVLASIAAYYRRVTTAARPMNRLIGLVMGGTLAALVVEIARGEDPASAGWVSLALLLPAVGLAGAHTFPAAVRLGARGDPVERQAELARSIYRDHLVCLGLIVALLVIQLAFAA